jgi:excisionase family DNA binding protein
MELSRPDIAALAALVAAEVQANILASLSPGRWLTMDEAMAYAKVKSPNTIRKWIDDGQIYAHKRSGHWIVDRESIDDWFSSEKVS